MTGTSELLPRHFSHLATRFKRLQRGGEVDGDDEHKQMIEWQLGASEELEMWPHNERIESKQIDS